MNNPTSKRQSLLNYIPTKTEPKLYEYESEIISIYIIDKIISLTLSNIFNNKVDQQVTKNCYSYMIETLNTFLNSQFITIDKEDEKENLTLPNFNSEETIEKNNNNIFSDNSKLNISLENIYFENYFRGENFWNLINEPKANKYDRYSSTLINYKIPFNKFNDNLNLEKVEEEIQLTTTSNFKLNKSNTKSRNNEYIKTKNYLSLDNKKMKKQNLGEIMNKFSFHDISQEENPSEIFKDKINLNELRLEKEMEIKKKEDEIKRQLKILKKEEEIKKEESQLQKQNEKKKLTIDPNGEIVFIKGIKLDKLSKEFLSIKSNMKILKIQKQMNEKPKKKEILIETNPNINNNIIYNLNNNNNNKENKENKEKKENNKILKRRRSSLPKIDNKENENEKEKEKEKKNNNFIPVKLDNKQNFSYKSLLEKKLERGPIYPIGSLFDKINLEIGVTMKENKKFKSGGKDFFLKYNKYSLETYNKKLKDNLSNFSIKTLYNLNSNSDLKNNFNESIISNNLGLQTSISLFKKNNSEINLTKNSELNSSLNPLIKLTGNFSLKSTLNDLDLINENNFINLKKLNRKNIFKEKTSVNNQIKYNEMNEFTSNLISNEKWGNNVFKNQKKFNPIKMPFKPLKREIEKEIGKGNIILRNREMHIHQFSKSMKNFAINNNKFNTMN